MAKIVYLTMDANSDEGWGVFTFLKGPADEANQEILYPSESVFFVPITDFNID